MTLKRFFPALTLAFALLTTVKGIAKPEDGKDLGSWQRPADPGAIANPNIGGSLLVDEGTTYLPRVRYHVDVHIDDGFARTTIDQVYFNRTNSRREGTYRFPLPGGASISRLAMTVKGELLEGGMVEQKRAAAIYNEIRNQRRDPVLLEWIDGRTFKMRVFPIEPGEYKRIIISYTERLDAIDDHWHYDFPGTDLQHTQESSIKVRAVSSAWYQWQCDTHDLVATKHGGDLLLEPAKQTENSSMQDSRFSLRIKRHPLLGDDGVRFDYFDSREYRYAMVRWRPDVDLKSTDPLSSRRYWSVIFEASADRDPVFARQQIDALREMIAANPDDVFSIIAANAEPGHIAEADLDKVHLIGALDLGRAFKEVARRNRGRPNHYILHLGGGHASMGVRGVQALAELLPEDTPYIGAGIGQGVNTALMAAAAERSGGEFSLVENGSELVRLTRQVSSQSRKITLTSADGTEFLTDGYGAFAGGDFFAVARIERGGELPASMTFRTDVAGGEWSRTIEPRWKKGSAGYLPRTWARMEIERLGKDAEANRLAIIGLSQQSFVMSPFTSLLVLESAKMHEQYGVGQGRSDHWAKYIAPLGELTFKPKPIPEVKPVPPAERHPEKPGMKEFQTKFPKPMFTGTPVSIRLPNLEGRPLGGRGMVPLVWRPMFAGQVVGLADSWRTQGHSGWPRSAWRPRLTFRAPVGTELLSHGSKVTSSDDLPIIGEVDMITDGDKDGADGSYVELGPDRQWVQLDLGAKREIWAVILWHFHKNARAYVDVVAQISDDPEFKEGVRTIYNNDHDNSSGLGVGSEKAWIETNHGRIIDVPGTAARYLRFYSNGNTANEMNHYVEIEVWGRKDIHEPIAPAIETEGWEKVADLEQATEEEWQRQHKAGAVDLGWLRESHAELLAAMSGALASEPGAAGDDFEKRIIRIADRWWAIDAGVPEPCHMAAALFRQLGREDLSWQYLTTPAAISKGSWRAWLSIETFARRHRNPAMAELARREADAARDAIRR